jgi:hypothetical protein
MPPAQSQPIGLLTRVTFRVLFFAFTFSWVGSRRVELRMGSNCYSNPKLAREMADNQMLDPATAAAIERVPGVEGEERG